MKAFVVVLFAAALTYSPGWAQDLKVVKPKNEVRNNVKADKSQTAAKPDLKVAKRNNEVKNNVRVDNRPTAASKATAKDVEALANGVSSGKGNTGPEQKKTEEKKDNGSPACPSGSNNCGGHRSEPARRT